jgi:hypothetical protein
MPTPFEGEGPLYPPTRADPAINHLFDTALSCPMCRADNRNLWPLMSAEREGVYVVSCSACHYIGDDGSSINAAITAWNHDAHRSE